MKIYEPWTPEQVAALNRWQRAGHVHSFTCGFPDCRESLVASTSGWLCPEGHYIQRWAHDFMFEPVPPMPFTG